MANSKLVYLVISIFLALVFFNGSISAVGRQLRIENKEQVTTYENSITEEMATAENIVQWRRHTLEFGAATAPDSDTNNPLYDDFRPTDPGHSPGAGHSSPNANVVPKP